MNSHKKSRFVARIAGALALSSLLIQPVLAGPAPAGSSLMFAAATDRCRTEETHEWAYPGGYLRGQSVTCDLLSDEVLVKGKLTLRQACPIDGGSLCEAMFHIVTDTGAHWDGVYWTEADGGQVLLEGAGLSDQTGLQIVFTLDNLMAVSGWVDGTGGVNVKGHIVSVD